MENTKKEKEWGSFTIGLFSKWQHHLSHPWTWHLFDSSSYSLVLSFLGGVPVIWVKDTPSASYSSIHHGECFNSLCVVALYVSSSYVFIVSQNFFFYMFKGSFSLSQPSVVLFTFQVDHLLFCWVSNSTIPVWVILGDTLSSDHILVYVWCRLMGDTLRPSFDGSPPIDFNTLSRKGI